jgi:hypothetical protein
MKLEYTLQIRDNGAEDKNIEIVLTTGNGRTRVTTDALVPALNQLKSTLAEDIEAKF